FVLRRRPMAGRADSTLLVVRDREVGTGLRESITLTNVGREPTTVMLTLHFEADFADLFSVKEGRQLPSDAATTLSPVDVVLRSSRDTARGVRVAGTNDPLTSPRSLTWRVVVPARGQWATNVI